LKQQMNNSNVEEININQPNQLDAESVVSRWCDMQTDVLKLQVQPVEDFHIVRVSNNSIQKKCKKEDSEYEFYEKVLPTFSPEIQDFFPKCFSLDPANYFVTLEDLTCEFDKPVILDIKVGYNTKPSHKQKSHRLERAAASSALGYRLTGYTYYEQGNICMAAESDVSVIPEKDQLLPHYQRYFTDMNNNLRVDVIQYSIDRIQKMIEWKKTDCEIAFYSSSILIVYSASSVPNTPNISSCKIIDLSHNVHLEEGKDENFYSGLLNLVNLFKEVLSKDASKETV